jgi:hypothetical protein
VERSNPFLASNQEVGGEFSGSQACGDIITLLNAVNNYNSGPRVPYAFLGTTNSNAFTYTLLSDIGPSTFFGHPSRIYSGFGSDNHGPNGAMKNALLCAAAVLGTAWTGLGQGKDSNLPRAYAYSPAFISTISSPGHTQLVVFPFYGKSFETPIRSASGGFVISSYGGALYGTCSPRSTEGGADERPIIALCKIDLGDGTATPIPGSSGLRVYSFAVSSHGDRIVFSGADRRAHDTFGLIELTQPEGRVRTILPQPDKRPQSQWMNLSLSPSNERAVGTHEGRLELIDIRSGSTEPLGGELFMAAWSPNGKWLAAVEKGQRGRTILMDAKTLNRQRTLGPSELDWSPDSRYILAVEPCGPHSGTLDAMSVETGERTVIESSRCSVNRAATGWVRSDLVER